MVDKNLKLIDFHIRLSQQFITSQNIEMKSSNLNMRGIPADISVGTKVGFGHAILMCSAGYRAAKLCSVHDDVTHQRLKLSNHTFIVFQNILHSLHLNLPYKRDQWQRIHFCKLDILPVSLRIDCEICKEGRIASVVALPPQF